MRRSWEAVGSRAAISRPRDGGFYPTPHRRSNANDSRPADDGKAGKQHKEGGLSPCP